MGSLVRLRHWRGWETFAVFSCLAILLVAYLRYDWLDPRRPASGAAPDGWWSFADQGRYLADTLAWVAGDMDPAKHWYLPGYGLLGAPFVRLTAANPFFVPDALLLLASLWLTAGIAAELLPGRRGARALGAGLFLLTAAMPPTMEVWVTPWSTTPAAPLILGCLLALLRFQRRPPSWRLALAASLCAAELVAVRPSDGAILLTFTAVVGSARLLAARPSWVAALRVVVAAFAGATVPLFVMGAFYVASHGWRLSDYLALSAEVGFEWRLLPLQWVTLVLDPQPMLPSGAGLLPTYPFIATGLAGMAACLAAPPGRAGRAGHALVTAAAIGYGAVYLCYRDLHPPGLWHYFNYHYFKWLLPIFGLYTVLLVPAVRRWPAALAAACTLAAILPWRADLALADPAPTAPAPGHRIALPDGLGIRHPLIVAARGTFDSIYTGLNHFYFGPRGELYFGATGSIAAYPVPDGLLLAPLRALPPGPGQAILDPRVTLNPAVRPRLANLSLVYGRPCYLPGWLGGGGAACQFIEPIPPIPWPMGVTVPFGDAIRSYLTTGWSPGEPDTLWTEGHRAGLRGVVQPTPTHGGSLALDVIAFLPQGSPALQFAILANGVQRGSWTIGDANPRVLHVALPPDAFGADGLLRIELQIENPRRPSDWLRSSDSRMLGLLVRSVTVKVFAQ